MFLSRHTVKSQAAPVHRKLGACSSRQVVAWSGISAPASRYARATGWEVPGCCNIAAGVRAWPCITGQVWAVNGGREL